MKYLTILLVVAILCISATSITKIIYTPATPIQTIVLQTTMDNMGTKIIYYASRGYIVKSMTSSQSQYNEVSNSNVLVVMEKY